MVETYKLQGAVKLLVRRLFPDLGGEEAWFVCEDRDGVPFPLEGPFGTETEADRCCIKRYSCMDINYVKEN